MNAMTDEQLEDIRQALRMAYNDKYALELMAIIKPTPVAVLTEAQILGYLKAANEQMRKDGGRSKPWDKWTDDEREETIRWHKAGFRAIGLLPPEPVETPGQRFVALLVDHFEKFLDVNLRYREGAVEIAKAYEAATAKARAAIKYKLGGGAVGDAEWRDALADLEIKK